MPETGREGNIQRSVQVSRIGREWNEEVGKVEVYIVGLGVGSLE